MDSSTAPSGKVFGFVLALILAKYHDDGKLPTPEELSEVIEFYVYDRPMFGADTRSVALGILDGISFAVDGAPPGFEL